MAVTATRKTGKPTPRGKIIELTIEQFLGSVDIALALIKEDLTRWSKALTTAQELTRHDPLERWGHNIDMLREFAREAGLERKKMRAGGLNPPRGERPGPSFPLPSGGRGVWGFTAPSLYSTHTLAVKRKNSWLSEGAPAGDHRRYHARGRRANPPRHRSLTVPTVLIPVRRLTERGKNYADA